VDGEEAFAWLVSMNTAEKVWEEVMGRPLTVAHSFPRNRYQRDLLQYLTEAFVEDAFSLKSLVAAVVLHPYFNPGMPEQCEGLESPYYLAPVFDPWVVTHETPELRLNNPGDAAERLPPRVLLGAVTEALDWPPIDALIYDLGMGSEGHEQEEHLEDARAFEIDIGVFLLDGETGFRSNNFGAGLAWEDVVGRCVNPFPQAEEPEQDWIDLLLSEAPQDASLEDLSLALKDRLIGRPDLSDPGERELVEALLAHPLDTALSEIEDADASVRRLCAALLNAPDFLLAGAPGADMIGRDPVIIPSGSSSQELCQTLAEVLFEADEADCDAEGVLLLSSD